MRPVKIFPFACLLFLGGGICSSTSHVFVKLEELLDTASSSDSSCSEAEISEYSTAFANWAQASITNVQVPACAHVYSVVTTTTSTTDFPIYTTATSVTPDSTTTFIPTTQVNSTTSFPIVTTALPSTTNSTQTPGTTSTTGSTPTTLTTPTTASTATPQTTPTTASTSLSTTTISSTVSSTTTSSKRTWSPTCPAIPPPSGSSYTDVDRNAYCALAIGAGSYCKCDQKVAGQECQQVSGGSGLKCSCASMCAARRRLASVSYTMTTSVTFQLSNIVLSVNAFLAVLNSSSLVVANNTVSMTGFDFAPTTIVGGGGTISALVDFQIASSSTRRLSSVAALSASVSQALTELLGPSLAGSFTVTTTTSNKADIVVANATVSVASNLASNQAAVSAFLLQDVSQKALPQLVSAKSSLAVSYSPGYVPIVWSSPNNETSAALNVLPYIVVGVVLLVLILAAVCWKYRFVLNSWWTSCWEPARSAWTGSSNMVTFASQFERGKSEISSTPDTATNLDQDEFEDLFIRMAAIPK